MMATSTSVKSDIYTTALVIYFCLQISQAGSRFCGFQRSATLERQKRFAFINQNTRVGKGTWPLPITVGWKSLLPDHVISRADQEEVIVSCLRKWAEVSGLIFTYVSGPVAPRQANIFILEGSALNIDDDILATGQEPNPFGDPPSSKIWIFNTGNPLKPYGSTPGQGDNLQEILCHEIGHTLNLDHASRDDPTSLMNDVLPNWSHDVVLGQDDINGIQTLYGPPDGKIFHGGLPESQFTKLTTVSASTTSTTAEAFGGSRPIVTAPPAPTFPTTTTTTASAPSTASALGKAKSVNRNNNARTRITCARGRLCRQGSARVRANRPRGTNKNAGKNRQNAGNCNRLKGRNRLLCLRQRRQG